ncbi:MAG: radical SAM protein [Thermodesulfobacterium sp.]|nr:radical SAM protein [Thermodesulfobacterium sp.]
MTYLRPFDPWGSRLCLCPPKYSLQPYTGCGHSCLYCYAQVYIKDFHNPRPKKDFAKVVEKDLAQLPSGSLISLSNSSDPYQPLEEKLRLTRSFLEMLSGKSVRLLIITKSPLVLRDVDILKDLDCAVSLTVTTKSLDKVLEPGAHRAEERINALKALKQAGIPVIARIDPVFPILTEDEAKELVKELIDVVDHFVFSTLKLKKQTFRRLVTAIPKIEKDYKKLYFEKGECINGSWYLPYELRNNLLSPLMEMVKGARKSFGLCREGLDLAEKGKCDGSFLIKFKTFHVEHQ